MLLGTICDERVEVEVVKPRRKSDVVLVASARGSMATRRRTYRARRRGQHRTSRRAADSHALGGSGSLAFGGSDRLPKLDKNIYRERLSKLDKNKHPLGPSK